MRLFTLLLSFPFTAGGIWMIVSGDSTGWYVAGMFCFCFLIALFEPWFPKQPAPAAYQLLISNDDIACEHSQRKRETIRWTDVNRIWYATTSDGPWNPDQWILLEGENGGCSFPNEAVGFEGIWDELKNRFPGFAYGPLISGGTEYAKHLCWERRGPASN